MMLDIRFSNETEAKLRARAQETGRDIEQVVRDAVEEKLSDRAPTAVALSPEARAAAWRAWAASHTAPPNVTLDDSRESIYAGRGE